MKNKKIYPYITSEKIEGITCIYLYISKNKIQYTEEYSPGLIVDYDKNNEIVGIEVIK